MPSLLDDEDLEKLSPRGMIPVEENEDKHYKCMICMKIVCEPMECSDCRTAFCSDCIEEWKKTRPKCPTGCANGTYVELHRVLKAQLYERRFKCPMEGCESNIVKIGEQAGFQYLKALEH